MLAEWRARIRACSDGPPPAARRTITPDHSRKTTSTRRARGPAARRRALPPRRDVDGAAAAPAAAPAAWFVLEPDLWQRIQADFPRAPWGPAGLLRVAGFSLAAAAAFAAAANALSPASSSSSVAADPPRALALAHLAREGMLAALIPGAVFLALKPDLERAEAAAAAKEVVVAAAEGGEGEQGAVQTPPLFRLSASWSGPEARYWLSQAVVTAAVAFPLAEPVLSSATAHALDALPMLSSGGGAAAAAAAAGGGPSQSLASAVRAAAEAGDWPSVGAHALASGILAPIWEEVFWRGFCLASLARVLAPAGRARLAVGASAAGFAALHLGAPSAPSLALLGACCDLLYLRSGGNLAAPVLFHGLWNAGQVAAVALGLKDGFL